MKILPTLAEIVEEIAKTTGGSEDNRWAVRILTSDDPSRDVFIGIVHEKTCVSGEDTRKLILVLEKLVMVREEESRTGHKQWVSISRVHKMKELEFLVSSVKVSEGGYSLICGKESVHFFPKQAVPVELFESIS
jgi:hypothetical protein